MKSILQEASSIERAIDKAWNEAGKPKEFTIKVLDQGERNFLGLTRRPAIVSILYKPEKSTYQQPRSRKERPGRSRNDRSRRTESGAGRSDRSNNSYEVTNRESAQVRPSRSQGQERRSEELHGWRDEWKQSVTTNLRQMLKHMSVKTPFQAEVTDDRVLTIAFKSAVLSDEEEQRMLFASLSYLSIQFLKREYKNRFTGFRIIVTGPVPKAKKRSVEKENKAEVKKEGAVSQKREVEKSDGRAKRPRRQRSERPKPLGNDQAHIDEQLKFAKQQLAQEGDLADVLEQVESTQLEKPATKIEKNSKPVSSADTASSQADDAKNAESSSRVAKPLKKEAKYQPFFVLPDEHGEESSGK